MSEEYKITEVTLDQLPLLLDWRMEVLAEVFAPLDPHLMSSLREANKVYYEEALKEGSHVACFAVIDGKPVGCGALCLQREMPSPDNPSGRSAYLMNIYVRLAYRHQHIGEGIVDWLIKRARSFGVNKIYLEASEIGRSLYEKAGFSYMQNMMKL
ncbi:MAG: GNAT family N-acetyltransferase [Bacteroidales bacterium]|nr:GNAT family N-acetyltransferase [Bacteroidales bacterium]